MVWGVWGVWGVWFRLMTFGKDQKGDQGGGPKMAKISGGVKPDIFKRRPKNGQNFGWGKKSRFRASSSDKKVLLTAEKWGRPKIDEKIGWGKTGFTPY